MKDLDICKAEARPGGPSRVPKSCGARTSGYASEDASLRSKIRKHTAEKLAKQNFQVKRVSLGGGGGAGGGTVKELPAHPNFQYISYSVDSGAIITEYV
ncbi:hypothetical protein EVAR_97844_1 [Eumeta japonica]|uniref:Uncharacterized protein n=1 Tax=Eumeta variegata TaxID=151549 RepID=A0A4C1WVU0_EUMVA|nr:hypothetical protein EVAR_97844_1 [Eumeta japonica]